MAWDRRNHHHHQLGREELPPAAAAMGDHIKAGHCPPPLPSHDVTGSGCYCFCISGSSDRFLSLHDQMAGDDWEKKRSSRNSRSGSLEPVASDSRGLSTILPPPAPLFSLGQKGHGESGSSGTGIGIRRTSGSSEIVFPQVMSVGSVVGSAICSSSVVDTGVTRQRKARTRRIHGSRALLDSYHPPRSADGAVACFVDDNDNIYFNAQSELQPQAVLAASPSPVADDPSAVPAAVPEQKAAAGFQDSIQCRGLLLGMAAAAGLRLFCPHLQYPLLDILLFSQQQLSPNSGNGSDSGSPGERRRDIGGGLFRVPLNLALVAVRPFCGSVLRRCLTGLFFVARMKVKRSSSSASSTETTRLNSQGPGGEMYSVVMYKNGHRHLVHSHRNEFPSACSVVDHSARIEENCLNTEAEAEVGEVGKSGRTLFSEFGASCTHHNRNCLREMEGRNGNGDGQQKRIVHGSLLKEEDAASDSFIPIAFPYSPVVELRLQIPVFAAAAAMGRGDGCRASSLFVDSESSPACALCARRRRGCGVGAFELQSCPSPIKTSGFGGCSRKAAHIVEGMSPNSVLDMEETEDESCQIEEYRLDSDGYLRSTENLWDRQQEHPEGNCGGAVGDDGVVERVGFPADMRMGRQAEGDNFVDTSGALDRERNRLRRRAHDGRNAQLNFLPGEDSLLDNFASKTAELRVLEDAISSDNFHSKSKWARLRDDPEDVYAITSGDSPIATSRHDTRHCSPRIESESERQVVAERDCLATPEVVFDLLVSGPSSSSVNNNSCRRLHEKIVDLNCHSINTQDGNHQHLRGRRSGPGRDLLLEEEEKVVSAEGNLAFATAAERRGLDEDEEDQGQEEPSSSYPYDPFTDHPTCINLRKSRHSHGDQTYLQLEQLLLMPWRELIFWHGRCKEGRPTLCVLLGKAVRELPSHELKHFIAVTISHVEYAELNFFKGPVKQMNILMDLEGLGWMRLPPMNILSSIGAFLNRDYAGRGGWLIMVNAPVMLGLVIGAIQGILLRPSYNKGAQIDSSFRGFLEGKERIMTMGSRYHSTLHKHLDASVLPKVFGGHCPCGSEEASACEFGVEFLTRLETSHLHRES